MVKLNIVSRLATICALLFIIGCSSRQEKTTTPKIIPVRVMEIATSSAVSGYNYVGTVEESFSLALSFSLPGNVQQVLVSEGERVQKGQLLAVLNSGTSQSTYDATLASLKQAQDAYDRLYKLHQSGSLPDIKFVEVETGLQQAKSMEAITRKNLADCKLYAPQSGIISKRSIEPGTNILPNASVFTLIAVDKVDIKSSIPENEIGAIRLGQTATIVVPALGNREFHGKIGQKGVTANPVSHTYEVRIVVDNPQLSLMPGMVGKVSIMNEVDSNRIIVPNRTVLITHDGKHFVWIADGSAAKRKFVIVGSLSNDGVVIEEGLKAGDRIIVDGYHKVSEGMQISIIQ
jgi:RND family efflux transporter, MFP subunit